MRTPKIRMRANGKYFVEYVDAKGKRIRRSLKTRDYAEAKVNYVNITGKFPEDDKVATVTTQSPSELTNQAMEFNRSIQ